MRRSGWILIAIAALMLALAGCAEKTGSDGKDGAAGATGATGATGDPGVPGEDFSLETANESCAACHGRGGYVDASTKFKLDGSSNSATGVHNQKAVTNPSGLTPIYYNAAITQVTLTTTTGDDMSMVVRINVTDSATGAVVDGISAARLRVAVAELKDPAASGVAEWVNYFKSTSSGFPTYLAGDATAATVATGQGTGTNSATCLGVGSSTGDYNCTIANAFSGIALKTTTHRVGVQISLSASATIPSGSGTAVNGWAEFVPSTAVSGQAINTASTPAFSAWGPGMASQAASAAAPANHLVDTANCNECHQGISAHGGTRRTVEFCILCHNGGNGGTAYTTTTTEGHSIDWKQMLHKLHYGKELPSVQAGGTYAIGSADFSTGGFPQSMSNCMKCHGDATGKTYRNPGKYTETIPGKATLVTGSISGDTVTGWAFEASKEACTSCHDNAVFTAAEVTGYKTLHLGGALTDTSASACQGCHTATGAATAIPKGGIAWAHGRQAQVTAAANYYYNVEKVTYTAPTSSVAGSLVVDYSVSTGAKCSDDTPVTGTCTGGGTRVDLTADAAFTVTTGSARSRLQLNVGWKDRWTSTTYGADYTNDGASDGTAPGMPKAVNALLIGGTYPVQAAGAGTVAQGLYRYTLAIAAGTPGSHTDPIPNAGTGIAMLEGHPVLTIPSSTGFKRTIPVESAYSEFKIRDSSYTTTKRRPVVNVAKCQECHNALSIHGDNRTASTTYGVGACTTCHNSANTDINVRPTDITQTADGLKEQSVDMKFMVHRIHKGRDLTYNFEIFGYGGSENEFGGEFPPGRQLNNCQNCHYAGLEALPAYFAGSGTFANDTNTLWLPDGIQGTTIDSGTSRVDHSDDLNISPNSAACSGCHDSDGAKNHMKLMGGSFAVKQADIEFY